MCDERDDLASFTKSHVIGQYIGVAFAVDEVYVVSRFNSGSASRSGFFCCSGSLGRDGKPGGVVTLANGLGLSEIVGAWSAAASAGALVAFSHLKYRQYSAQVSTNES